MKDGMEKSLNQEMGECTARSDSDAGNVQNVSTDQNAQNAQDAVRASRRRMLRAGLVAAPMIVTLRGRPALAQAASLGSLGIFYGQYTQLDSGDWVPADPDGNPLYIPGTEVRNTQGEIIDGDIDHDRRNQ